MPKPEYVRYHPPMRETSLCTLEPAAGVLIVRLKGPALPEQEAKSILADIQTDAPSQNWRVALDMTGIDFLASAGIGALISMQRACQGAGGRMVMFGVNDNIEGVFKVTKMNKFFVTTKDRQQAIKKLT